MPIYDAKNLAAFPTAAFSDVLEGNHEFVQTFADSGLTGRAAKGLAVVTPIAEWQAQLNQKFTPKLKPNLASILVALSFVPLLTKKKR